MKKSIILCSIGFAMSMGAFAQPGPKLPPPPKRPPTPKEAFNDVKHKLSGHHHKKSSRGIHLPKHPGAPKLPSPPRPGTPPRLP